MNFRFTLIFLAISIFISSFSCSNKPNRSRKPTVSISVTSVHQKIIFGDDVSINVAVKLKDGDLQETKIFVDSVLLTTTNNYEYTHHLKKFKSIGKHTVKIVASKTDGVEGTYFKTFEVFSDVVPEIFGYEVVNSYPHDENKFTQGLEIHNGFLYEGTGENGKSAIYKTNLKTGKSLQSVKMPDRYFGEGITILNNRLYQLTYKTKVGFVYNLENLAVIDSFSYESAEGWGLTNDGNSLIMSDGTNYLTYINPTSYKSIKKIQVYDDKEAILYLNELEYSDDFIYANVWGTNLIVKIEPETGRVLSKINLDGILAMINSDKPVDVLNGIAIEPATKKMYITGKYYSKLFEIKPVKKG